MLDLLNLEPNKVSKDLSSYTNMVYGNPKAGKSTLAYNFFGKEALFLGFEDGTRALAGAMAIPVPSWEKLIRDEKIKGEDGKFTGEKRPSINKQLKDPRVKEKFKVLIIDTVDLMYEACEKYICEEAGVDNISDIDFGKGYKDTDAEFKRQLVEWESLGYRLFFISHAEDKTMKVKDHKGVEKETSKFVPTVNKRGFKIVSKMVDNILFAYKEMKEDGTEKRAVFTRDTTTFFAGSRFKHLPAILPMDADKIKKEIADAIEKEELTTDDKSENGLLAGLEAQFESFEDVKSKVVELVKSKFKPNDKMEIVTELTSKHLGKGATIGGATEADIDGMDAIFEELTAKANDLGL